MNPRVVTYTPNWNYHRKGFLVPCLESLTNLTYQQLDILIIDDGSDDGSQEVISEYARKDSRITFIPMPHRGLRWGQGYINKALRWANEHEARYFNVLGSDDLIEPEYWETVLPYFTSDDIGFVRVGMWMFGDCPTKWIRPKPWHHLADILAENKAFNSSPFRMEMWREIGDWDDNVSWSDWDFWARAVIKYGWKYGTCNEPVFRYRRHGAQLAASSATTKHKELVDYMMEKYSDALKGMPVVRKFGRRISEDKHQSIVAEAN